MTSTPSLRAHSWPGGWRASGEPRALQDHLAAETLVMTGGELLGDPATAQTLMTRSGRQPRPAGALQVTFCRPHLSAF